MMSSSSFSLHFTLYVVGGMYSIIDIRNEESISNN